MAMTEKTRSTLYRGLMDLVHDEEAVGEVLSYFPARDVEEPVTKDFLRAEFAGLRTEMAEFRTEMRTEMSEFRTEMRAEMSDFRTEMRAEMAEFRTETRAETAGLRTDMERMVRTMQAWTVGTGISLGGLVVAVAAFVR